MSGQTHARKMRRRTSECNWKNWTTGWMGWVVWSQRLGAPWRADDLVASSMKQAHYNPVVKLVRTEESYAAHRMTYRGHGGWSEVLCSGPLSQVAQAVAPVSGAQRFFELL